MGKKKDKLLAQQSQQQQQQQQQVDWKSVDSDPVGFLVAPEARSTFFSKYWEQQPLVSRATPARAALCQGLSCTFPTFINWLKQREKKSGPLEFGVDVNAARYRDGTRETPNGEVADAATLSTLHNSEGCTLQVHQPQRFFDPCWRLLAALERELGCLVGTNAYMTPTGTQGLAPHHDDVELWVLQTAGRKRWRIYEPLNGFMLPNNGSGDLDQSVLGGPVLEVELAVGDCLYMPRGTVHQAVAVEGADSDHLTISTYQRCSYADLATHVLQVGLSVQEEDPRCLPLAARFSPAPGTLLQHSLHRVLAQDPPGTSTTPDAIQGLAGALRAIADKLEGSQGAGMLTAAVHSSAIDFLMNRLPPHPKQLAPKGRAPTLDDKVWCRVTGWCYLLPFEMTGMVCEDDDQDAGIEEGCMKLCTCLANSREEHMIIQCDDEEEDGEDDSQGGDSSGEEDDSDSGSEHDSGAAAGEAQAEAGDEAANGHSGEGGGSHSGDDRLAHKDGRKGHKGANAGGKKAAAAGAAGVESGDEADHHHHHHHHDHDHDHECDDEGCGGHGHSLSSGAGGPQRTDPVAAMPGLVFSPKVVKSVIAFMAADTPDKAIAVRDLGLSSEAASLQFAFALWAEDLAATVPGTGQPGAGKKEGGKEKAARKEGGKKGGGKRGHAGGGEAGGEQVATSGRERSAKKSKA